MDEDATLPVGLPNTGVTCYLASIVQCLFSIDVFRQHLESSTDVEKPSLGSALLELFDALEDGQLLQ